MEEWFACYDNRFSRHNVFFHLASETLMGFAGKLVNVMTLGWTEQEVAKKKQAQGKWK